MWKKILLAVFLVFCGVFLSGCSLKKKPAALNIVTTPTANVFLDSKLVGKTPYKDSNLKAGEIIVKLVPESADIPLDSWEGKISLKNGVMTLLKRDFASTETASSGEILTLEKIKDNKIASLSVVSDPDGALVKVDGEAKGFTPLTIEKVNEGGHEISISKEGFSEKLIAANAALGYKLFVSVKLGGESVEVISPTPQLTATSSGKPTPSTKPTPSVKPKPTTADSSSAAETEVFVQITETPTGWLRVRSEASTTATEMAKVNPGEKYLLLEKKTGWYKIRFEETKEGWISSQYAKIVE